MNVQIRHRPIIATAAILLAATVITGQPVLAQTASGCEGVSFSEDVLSRFPNAAHECLNVITRDGQHYAVFKAQLLRVEGQKLRLRMKRPDGSLAEPVTVKPRQKLKVLVDGQSVEVDQLAPDQELTAYVRVDKPVIALAPATPEEPLELEPIVMQPAPPAAPPVAQTGPVMPRTAGQAGIFAFLAGLNLLIVGASVTARMMNRRRDLDCPPSP